MDVLVGYCEPWNTPLRTSKHHYIERLATAGHRFLYLEMPTTPLSVVRRPAEFFGETLARLRAGVRTVAPNVWAMTGFCPFPFHRGLGGVFDRPWMNTRNQQIFLPRITHAMRTLGFDRPVIWSYYPLLVPVLESLAPRRVVLHMVDEWQGLAGIPHSMAALTRFMLQRADATIVTSRRLFVRYQDAARSIHLLRHGTDVSQFRPVAEGRIAPDPRLAALGDVRVGYYGALHKLDFDLIRNVARQRPSWSFVFVGPRRGSQGGERPVSMSDNVVVWDAWPRSALPGFLAALDVFWMPFLRNELTRSMCPIKLFEALSAGSAIVSTDLDEIRDAGGELVRYASTADEHVAAIARGASANGTEERMRRAIAVEDCDWSDRTAVFAELLLGRPMTTPSK